jgi:MEMO1 family protein
MSDDCPKLRPVEAFPVEHEGQSFIALRDPAGYTSSVLMVPFAMVAIVEKFDGEHSITDIQADVMRTHGELLFRHQIEALVETLDEHGLLDSPRFAARRAAIDAAFLGARSRPAAHAGAAYPADAAELTATMSRFFEPPAGPGAIDQVAAASPGASEGRPGASERRPGAPVDGIIAPHIDFQRGGPAYGWAYRDLAERCDADVFVVFGTCHAGMRDPFALTRKEYETPFGAIAVDEELVDALVARAPLDLLASELAHRTEHSIEFQAVFLRYLFHGRRRVTIVPILTSFAHEAMLRGTAPEDDPTIMGFFEALADVVHGSGRRVAFVAGADLAHVGPRFGDPDPVSSAALAEIGREDRAMLEKVEEGDAKAFFTSIAADRDRRRICGFSPIWSLLHMLPGRRGALRHYGQWPDPQAVVTYASVVF